MPLKPRVVSAVCQMCYIQKNQYLCLQFQHFPLSDNAVFVHTKELSLDPLFASSFNGDLTPTCKIEDTNSVLSNLVQCIKLSPTPNTCNIITPMEYQSFCWVLQQCWQLHIVSTKFSDIDARDGTPGYKSLCFLGLSQRGRDWLRCLLKAVCRMIIDFNC